MSTAFIALFLFGLSLLISREFSLVTGRVTGNVRWRSTSPTRSSPRRSARLQTKLERTRRGRVQSTYWDKARHVRAVREAVRGPGGVPGERGLRGGDPDVVPGEPVRPGEVRRRSRRRWPASRADTGQIECTEPGVRNVADYRAAARPAHDDHERAVSSGVLGDRGASCWPPPSPWSRTRCGWGCSPGARRSASCVWWAPRTGASACRS